MQNVKAFIDSDVIISSLISKTGASYLLLNKPPVEFDTWISNHSTKECKKVCKRLDLNKNELTKLAEKAFSIVSLDQTDKLEEKYGKYSTDRYDAHIVAGAVEAEAQFIITYNQKDYLERKIKNDFGIVVATPGTFLQFLRGKAGSLTFEDSDN